MRSTSTTGDLWQPTSVRRVIRVLDTSTRPIECILDDGEHAFVKVMGNPEGPSALACEFVGTRAAALLGLPVFDVAIPEFPKELTIDRERESVVYGLFPEFVNRIDREELTPFVERLSQLGRTNELEELVGQTPKQWLSDGQVRQDLPGFLKRRAMHVATNLETWLMTECKWDQSPASDL